MSGKLSFRRPSLVSTPAPEPPKTKDPEEQEAVLLQHVLDQLNQLNSIALTGLKAMNRPVPASQPEAWEFEVIRGADGRIKKIKATRG